MAQILSGVQHLLENYLEIIPGPWDSSRGQLFLTFWVLEAADHEEPARRFLDWHPAKPLVITWHPHDKYNLSSRFLPLFFVRQPVPSYFLSRSFAWNYVVVRDILRFASATRKARGIEVHMQIIEYTGRILATQRSAYWLFDVQINTFIS